MSETSHSVETGSGRVVVVIVSYGRPEDIVVCLAALQQSTYADFEVGVIENAGSLALDRLCAALAKVLSTSPSTSSSSILNATPGPKAVRTKCWYLEGGQRVTAFAATENLGFAGGVNAIIAAIDPNARWSGVWLLNPDTIPERHALAAAKAYAEHGYGLVGSRIVFADRSRVQLRGGRWRKLIARGASIGVGDPPDAPVDTVEIERQLEWVHGVAAYATRDFVREVGPMPEQYFLYCEDVDWSLRGRAMRLGYAHRSVVYHVHGTTIGSATRVSARSPLSVYLTERNKLLLTRDWFPAFYPLVIPIALALSLEYWIRGNRELFVVALRGLWAGIRHETGRPTL